MALLSLGLPAVTFGQGSASIVTDKRDRPDYERRVGRSDYAVTMTAIGTLAAIEDGVLMVEVSGQRFQSKPDEGTKFTADKKTPLAGRKDLGLGDLSVGNPVKLTFVAETGKLLEVRLRYEKPRDAKR
jgi:hypothetical protein